MITPEQILSALRYVEDPDLKKDLVTLNMIEDLTIEGNKVSFSVVLTTPACPMKDMLENACRNAILHFVSKDVEIDIRMTSRVTSRQEPGLSGIKNIIVVASMALLSPLCLG
jgi:ATP-binding protein involved in chromosome partitioning